MTIAKELSNRNVWKCDICGKEDIWQKTWTSYGSILMEDYCPDDIFTVCSDDCKNIAEQKLKSEEIKLPKLKIHGYDIKIISPRLGY